MSGKQGSFVQAVEVWCPDGDLLQRQTGAYGHLADFARASAELTLRKGQGLPGAAWATMRPEVWHQLGPSFVRAQSAGEAGLDAAVAVPFFRGSELMAIVVFFCGSRAQTGGCIELWEPEGEDVLELSDGYYGRLHEFEVVSRAIKFALGQGLPGAVWQSGAPSIIDDLTKSTSFLRAAAASTCGVSSGLGLPLYCGGRVEQVLLFLSAQATPLARAFEIWTPEPDGSLRLLESHYDPSVRSFEEHTKALGGVAASDLASRVYQAAVPRAVDLATAPEHAFVRKPSALAAGLDIAIALPIHDGEVVRAVVVLLI